jgi:integrase
LLVEGRTRDLAMFNLAIDSKLRGCDVVAVKVEDVAPNGYAIDRATVRQKKTGRPVKFELTNQTREALDDYLKAASKKCGEFLFTGRRGIGQCMTTRQYARLVSEWVARIGLDPKLFGTIFAMRRIEIEPADYAEHGLHSPSPTGPSSRVRSSAISRGNTGAFMLGSLARFGGSNGEGNIVGTRTC